MTTAAVLAGAGARGAFEAGALAGLLPSLASRPDVLVGTSAGSINAVLFASVAHLPPEEQAAQAFSRWTAISASDVIRPPLLSLAGAATRYLGGLAGLPVQPHALLDSTPLLKTLAAAGTFEALHANVADGTVAAVAVTTTEVVSGRTVVWVEAGPAVTLPADDAASGVSYVAAQLTPAHVRASSAIPAAFAPVQLTHPDGTGAWYVDGGVRLNVPLAPAIALGADELVVVSSDTATRPLAPVPSSDPGITAVVDQVLHALTGDRLVEDLASLRRVNRLLAGGGAAATTTGRAYRNLPALLVTPAADGDLGALAEEALAETDRSLWRSGHLDAGALGFLLRPGGPVRGDLLSFLFFDAAFTRRAAALGVERGESAATAGFVT